MKESAKAYLAGLLDAEGYCTVVRGRIKNKYDAYSCRVGIVNTYRPIMTWIVKNFGGSFRTFKNRPTHHYLTYEWTPASSKHSEKILSYIFPFLVIKKRKAEQLLKLYKLNGCWAPDVRQQAYELIRKCNFGSVTTDTPSFPGKLFHSYFSGFFDGEGTIVVSKKNGCKKPYYVLGIRIGNTDPRPLNRASKIYQRPVHSMKTKGLPFFMLDFSNHETQESFLVRSLPYLKIKREQALLALTIIRSHHVRDEQQREEWFLEMKRLKTIGKKIQSELTGDGKSVLV